MYEVILVVTCLDRDEVGRRFGVKLYSNLPSYGICIAPAVTATREVF
jgi:hypothetical protein